MANFVLYLRILELLVIFLLLDVVFKVSAHSYKRMTSEPTFLNTPRNVTVHMNEFARLQCRIKHLGPKQVAWRKVSMDYPLTVGTITFDPKEDITVSYKDLDDHAEGLSQWDLIIKRAQPRHSGMYECQISAKNVFTHYVYLKVLDTPLPVKPSIALDGTSFVNLHEPIRLTCNVTGRSRAQPSIDWFFDGRQIFAADPRWDSRLHISDTASIVPERTYISELIIYRSMSKDKGKYVCRSLADHDFQTTSMDVSVLNKKEVEKREFEEHKNLKSSSSTDKEPSNSGHLSCLHPFYLLIVILKNMQHWF